MLPQVSEGVLLYTIPSYSYRITDPGTKQVTLIVGTRFGSLPTAYFKRKTEIILHRG